MKADNITLLARFINVAQKLMENNLSKWNHFIF